jgi:hypothetical protein
MDAARSLDRAMPPGLVRRAHAPAWEGNALGQLARELGPGPFAEILIFASPRADLARIGVEAGRVWPGVPVVGCTTAGEISADGYAEGQIVAVALPAAHFAVRTLLLAGLDRLPRETLLAEPIRLRAQLAEAHPDWPGEFGFVLVDGLSLMEDELASALAMGLGPVPLFGGSAGDGLRFAETLILHDGQVHRNAAVLSFIRTACPVKVFSLDHMVPSDIRMVVTEADPRQRIVRAINAAPAALEYARLLGKDPGQLTTFTFAAHPVVVRLGEQHHVRSIQRMLPNGDLVFFSAIDEGLVLRLAEPMNMARHLEDGLSALSAQSAPVAILACDCILRRIEAEEKQMYGELSRILQRHRVTGFSTYGEQFGPLHVNQTMTGVAIYPPAEGP